MLKHADLNVLQMEQNQGLADKLKSHADWLLKVGEGKLPKVEREDSDYTDLIAVLPELCVETDDQLLEHLYVMGTLKKRWGPAQPGSWQRTTPNGLSWQQQKRSLTDRTKR